MRYTYAELEFLTLDLSNPDFLVPSEKLNIISVCTNTFNDAEKINSIHSSE